MPSWERGHLARRIALGGLEARASRYADNDGKRRDLKPAKAGAGAFAHTLLTNSPLRKDANGV